MRIIARHTLENFALRHPETRVALERWSQTAKSGRWASTQEVQSTFSKAKVLNFERVRFEVAGGNYRMIVAFDFGRQVAFIKFLGTHAEYDRVDALTIAQF